MYDANDSQIILFNFREFGRKPLESSHFERYNPFFLTFPVKGTPRNTKFSGSLKSRDVRNTLRRSALNCSLSA